MTFEMKLAPATCGFSATPYGCREGAGAYTPFPLCEPKRVAFPKCSEARRQVWSHVARPCASYTETRTRGNNVSNDFFPSVFRDARTGESGRSYLRQLRKVGARRDLVASRLTTALWTLQSAQRRGVCPCA